MDFLDTFFVEKTKCLLLFFSNQKLETRVYWYFLGVKSRIFFFYAFLRISLRKMYILKKTKTNLIELTEIYCRNNKLLPLNLTNILKSAPKKSQKKGGKKVLRSFSYLYML